MNKLFAALLFFCVVGASVLWWLMKMLPENRVGPESQVTASEVLKSQANNQDDVSSSEKDNSKEAEISIPILKINTIPSGAKVELSGVYQGVTPLDIALSVESKEVLIALDGYEVYRKPIPAVEDAEGTELNWQISLKPKPTAIESKKPTINDSKNLHLKGSKGPYFIQFKAYAEPEGRTLSHDRIIELRSMLKAQNISGCLVDLGARGQWHRVLAGPYQSRAKANEERLNWVSKNTGLEESFITGRQDCI